ncbi:MULTISPECIES: hypothetical protein [Paraburkholderia]|jgi:hypothetical protein|uniref:hypothetical protein n=1 Tax=Paraburkholderia TaxID=1822464 RepID=UPI00191257F1|nr:MULTISPECIES: hypothetical protein [Paraburkholderia]MBK5180390.1 hypothetical protein [Burkholderia sp. R-69749]CAE6773593.1 hypothetical protein R75777_04015 [Paraburkholderia nemoris]CAE6791495.1 hypothetical protein R69749_02170 [Paraburkholderia domus]
MLYVDVDALCKLAHWNVLPHLPELIGHPWDEIATVTSLRYRTQRCIEKPDGKKFHSTDAAASLAAHLELMAPIGMPDSALLAELAAIPQIDEGEAVLLSLALSSPDSKFLTGDKRALRGLAGHDACQKFAGRIILIEQVLGACLSRKGHAWLLANVCPFKQIDRAIAAILGSRCDANLESLKEGFRSYIGEIGGLYDPSMLFALNMDLP